MATSINSTPCPQCPSSDDARAAYAVAVELRLEVSRGVWQRFNIMLLTNSIILLGVVTALTSSQPLPVVGLLLNFFGIIVCWVWLTRIRDTRPRFEDYDHALECLESCLPGVTTFASTRANRVRRTETPLSTWLKKTWVDSIGAVELTVFPLTFIYVYLTLWTLDQINIRSLSRVAEVTFVGIGLLLILAAILFMIFAVYEAGKNLRLTKDKRKWRSVFFFLILGIGLGVLGTLLKEIAPWAI
jgi:hypothetical protein